MTLDFQTISGKSLFCYSLLQRVNFGGLRLLGFLIRHAPGKEQKAACWCQFDDFQSLDCWSIGGFIFLGSFELAKILGFDEEDCKTCSRGRFLFLEVKGGSMLESFLLERSVQV